MHCLFMNQSNNSSRNLYNYKIKFGWKLILSLLRFLFGAAEKSEHTDFISGIGSNKYTSIIDFQQANFISSQHKRRLRSLVINPCLDHLCATRCIAFDQRIDPLVIVLILFHVICQSLSHIMCLFPYDDDSP